jgi:FixJ family two-component response regulator
MIREIFIVEHDYELREAMAALFRGAGYRATAFTDGRSFVRMTRGQIPLCVLLDLGMPGISGVDFLREIDARTYPAPVIVVSGQDDILNVVQAMRNGAFDYIDRRLDAAAIVARVIDAIDAWNELRQRDDASPPLSPTIPGYHHLTRREREVLSQIAAAASNKETARNLGISPRTVEIHRGRIMRKLGAKNSVDLMRIIMNKQAVLPEVATAYEDPGPDHYQTSNQDEQPANA